MTKQIPLTRGFEALVDDEDYERVIAAGKWQAMPDSRDRERIYVGRDAGGRTLKLHTFLTGWSITDHINGDTLDNRRANLRSATRVENARNRKVHKNNASGFKGVHLNRTRWRAAIRIDGRLLHLGYHATPEDAARAYDAAAREHHGEFACVNFPTHGERSAR